MRINLNWLQRCILAVAGLLLLLFAANAFEGHSSDDRWLATALFLAAVVCFILSTSSRAKTDGQ